MQHRGTARSNETDSKLRAAAVVVGQVLVPRVLPRVEPGFLEGRRAGACLAREIQRIEQGMGWDVRDSKDCCAVLLLGDSRCTDQQPTDPHHHQKRQPQIGISDIARTTHRDQLNSTDSAPPN
ncbi:hypothetical protein ACWD4L_13865 [Streptomyces sp. NPDC002596]